MFFVKREQYQEKTSTRGKYYILFYFITLTGKPEMYFEILTKKLEKYIKDSSINVRISPEGDTSNYNFFKNKCNKEK